MKATTYNTNPFIIKATIMKNFYFRKYITIIGILVASIFGASNIIAQTAAPSGVRLATDAVSGNLVTSSSKDYEVFYLHPSNTASVTTLAIKTWDGTTTTVGATTWCNIGATVGNTSASTTAGTYGEYTITASTRWARVRASNQPTYQVVFNVEGYASVSTFYMATGTVLFDIKEWDGSAYVASGLTGTESASGSYYIRRETLNTAKRYQITIYGTGSGTTNYNMKAFALEVPTVACSNPSITAHPSGTGESVCVGGSPTALSITATGAASYQWYSSTNTTVGDGDDAAVSGATSASYTPSAASASTKYFYCKAISGACSTNSTMSGLITINALPTITLGANPSVASGASSADLTYSATTGSPNEYAINWTSGPADVALTTLPASPIVINTTSVADGTYSGSLTVKNTTTGCTSSAYTVGVTLAPACSNPTIDTQPSTGTQTLCVGGTPTNLTIAASGTALTYQWYSSVDGALGSDTNLGAADGAQTATYTPSTASAAALYYFCIVSSGACTTTSNMTGLITVNAAPSISAQPGSATAVISGAATSMAVTASNATGYQWQYCSTSGGSYTNVVNDTPTGITYTNATSATLGITAGATASAGNAYYKCVVSGTAPCASTTSSAGTLTISATGGGGNIALLYTSTTPPSGSDDLYTGLVNAGYTVTTLLASNTAGDTAAIMSNLLNNYDAVVLHEAVSSTNLTAIRLGTYIGRIPILNMKVHMFGKTNWPTGAGNNGVATDVSVTRNTTYSSHSIFSGVTFSGDNATMSTNVIRWVDSPAAGYKVLALNHSNTAGSAAILEKDISTTLGEKMVTIGMSAAAEAFTANGFTVLSNAVGYLLKKSIFASVDASGNGTISDTGETLLTSGSNKTYTFTPSGGYQVYDVLVDGVSIGSAPSSYTFTNVTATHSIKVVFGAVCSNPTIDVQPSTAGQTLCANANATDLSVTASGTALTYQWYSNTSASNTGGTLLTGATSATYDPSTATAGTKYYYCTVKSSGGCPVSTNVTGAIVVNANPSISSQSTATATYSLNAAASAISVTAAGAATLTYQWYSSTDAVTNTSGDDVALGTSASYTPLTSSVGTKYYYCVVSSTTCATPVTSSISGAIIVNNVAPTLTAAVGATVDAAFNVTFADDATWRAAISSITIGGTTLTAGYSVSAGQITFTPSASAPTTLLQTSGSKSIVVIATGYPNATVTQAIGAGAATKLAISTQPTAPATNGGTLGTNSVILVQDQYSNTVTSSSAAIAAAVGGGGTWTIGGTTSVNASSGSSTFSTLTATNAGAAYTGATVTYSSAGLTSVTSNAFNIPAPLSTADYILTATTATTTDLYKLYNTTYVGGSGANQITVNGGSLSQANGTLCDWGEKRYYIKFSSNGYMKVALPAGSAYNISKIEIDLASNGTSASTPAGHYGYSEDPAALLTAYTNVTNYNSASNATCGTLTINPIAGTRSVVFGREALGSTSDVGGEHLIFAVRVWVTTAGTPPSVTTNTPATSVESTTATSGGNVTAAGDDVATVGTCWNTATNPTVALTTKTSAAQTTTGTFSSSLTSLTPNTLYYVRAYATGAGGTGYGDNVSFTTKPAAPVIAAESSVTSTSFVANWTAPTTPGTATYTYTVEVDVTAGNFDSPIHTFSLIPSGTLSQTVTGLSASTGYKYRVFAVNTTGSSTASASEAVTTTAPAPEINITQAGNSYLDGSSTYAFGEVTNGSTSDITFTIQNTGAGTLTLTSSAVTGTGFNLQTAPGTTIAGGATETFVVRFSPVASVAYTGTITIVSDDADEATYTISLTGSGTTNLTAPGSLVSSAPATDGFTLGWNTVTGVDGYEVKVCQVNTSTTLISQTDMSTWTSFPATNCTQVIDFKADHLGTVSQSTADGTFTIYNSINGESSTCQYVQMGKTAQTAINAQGYWDGNSVDDIDADGVKDGGFIVFPATASAGTLTLSVSSTGTSGRTFAIQKSLDGGTTWSLVANSDANSSTAVTRTITVNEPAECILRLKVTASNIVRVHSIALTSYMLCATPVVKAGQATNSHTFTGLNPNDIYYYSARSYQTAGPTYSNWTTLSALNTEVTLPLAPATSSVTGITTTGMTINWTAPATVGTQTYTYTVEYSTASDYSGATTLAGIPSGTLSQALTGLSMNQLYYYRVRCENVSGGGAWITGSATTLASVPTVTTTTVSAVEQTTATSGGNVTNNGGSAIINMGLVYHTSANPTTANGFKDEASNTTGAFTSLLTALAPNTLYYYRGYAENAQGAAYGTESTFVTKPNSPNIGAANTATPVGFTANWTAPTIPGNQTYTYTVEVSTNSADFTSPVASASGIASGTTSYVFNSLLSNTEYFFRVKAVNATGSSDFVVQTTGVTTLAGAPAVTTTSASDITSTSAIWGGDVTANGGTTVDERGVVYNTSTNPTIANSKDANGSGLGVFSETNSALTANTKYYYRAYASGANGYTGYGTQYDLTTLPAAPTATAATTETGSGFTANWTAPTQGSETFTYDVIVSATSANYTTPAASYTGILSSNLSKVVTGLNASTTYYYKVRAVNASGAGEWSNEITTATIAQKTLTATFSNGTVTANGISLTSGIAANFSVNEEVILTATPAANYGFLRWVINGVDQISDNPYTVTLTDNTTVSAVFGGASCATSAFDAACNLSTSNVTNTVFTDGTDSWLGIAAVRLNTSSSYSHSGNNSVRLYGNLGAFATYATNRPVAIKLWARMYNTGYTGNIKVYISTDGGSNYETTPIINETVTGASWVQYTANVNTTSTNVKFKIFNGTGNSSTSYDIVVDDVEICTGPDAVAPTFTFVPTSGATGVLLNADVVATASEALYRYYPATGAFVQLTTAALAGMSADSITQFMSLRNVLTNAVIPAAFSIDATGKIITVNPTSDFPAYNTQYKLSISNVADASQNITATTQYTQFTTRPDPVPEILIEEVASSTEVADDGTVNMGTIISGTYVEKTFRITNTALLDPLTITGCSFGTGTKYTIEGTNPTAASPLAAGASTTFVVRFTPGATPGNFTDVLTITNNDPNEGTYAINFTGNKAAFVLPYTFESGCTTPIVSATELKHDYTSLSDIPAEISLNNGALFDADHFFVDYSVFHVEGNCMPSGSTALRIGQGNNSLEIESATQGVGMVTVKWCANGYRKIRITDELGNVYIQSPTYQAGENCYTSSAVVNRSGAVTVDVEFIGTDPALLTTVYFLEVTPYNPALKSAAKNIIDISTNIATEQVRIYDDVVFISVPNTNPLNAITTDLLKVSPFATVSPGLGTQNYSAGPVNYTVTAEDGTTKVYKVYVEHIPVYTGYYRDTVEWTTLMNSQDQIIEVIEISNPSCTVPVSGNGSAYTLYFLDSGDLPTGGYNIGGLSQVCIGSTVQYSLTNAPATNSPNYTWTLTGEDIDLFTVIGATTQEFDRPSTPVGIDSIIVDQSLETLTLQAPNEMTTADLSIKISVQFDPTCEHVEGDTEFTINVTENAPLAVDTVIASCVENGLLTLTAKGAGASATTYGWTFSNPQTIVSQTDSTITLNIGTSVSDVVAEVVTQNGCGYTAATHANNVVYGTPLSEWTGTTSSAWDNTANWTGRVPQACTNVIIPNVNVPGVEYPTIGTSGVCHYITFEPGGAVLGIEKLDYTKAFVQLELNRDKWYTLTSPLKEMYSGDYFFSGAPVTNMKLFDAINPDSLTRGGTITEGTFTRSFAASNVELTAGMGFAYNVTQKTWDYPNGSTNVNTPQELTFPRMNADSSLFVNYIPYSGFNGKPNLFKTVTVSKDADSSFRFAIEDGNGNIPSTYTITIPTGKSLIGNPVMTHLNITDFLNRNAAVLNPDNIRLWTGTTYISYSLGTWSGGGYTGDFIAPMQSFIVESATGGDIDFVIPDDFGADDNASALRLCPVNQNMLHIESQNGVASAYATVTLNKDAKNEFDTQDVDKLFTPLYEVADVYTLSSNTALDFNRFNKYPYTTPLGIRSSNYGKTTLKFRGANTFADAEVYLVNTATNEKVNLKEQASYEFDLTAENGEGTLFLEFRSASTTTGDDEVLENGDIQIFTKEGNIVRVISTPQDLIQEVVIMDETGRVILINKNLNVALFDTTLNNGSKVVMVKVTTQNGVKTAKVLIK